MINYLLFSRYLAQDLSVQWCEYWDFLDGFADLNTAEGLSSLDQYLGEVELESTAGNESEDDMFDCSDVFTALNLDSNEQLTGKYTIF